MGGKQHPMDIIFPLFSIEFTVHIPLLPNESMSDNQLGTASDNDW